MRTHTITSLASLLLGTALIFAGCSVTSEESPGGQVPDPSSSSGAPSDGSSSGTPGNGSSSGTPGNGSSSGTPGNGSSSGGQTEPSRPAVEVKFLDRNITIDQASPYTPMDMNGIPPFSSGLLTVNMVNLSGDAFTVERIVLEPVDADVVVGNGPEDEYIINQPGNVDRVPFSIDGEVVAHNEGISFGVHFTPYYSGPRAVRVRVFTTDNREASFVLGARGRDNLVKSPKVESAVERVLSRTVADLYVSGMVSDHAGGTVTSMNVKQILDNFSFDIGVVATNADGSRRWAKLWSEDFDQSSPDSGQNGETGGGAESIAQADGFVYVAGRRSRTAANSLFQGTVMKIDAANGSMVWARGLANGRTAVPTTAAQSVEGYALDATLADRVLLTGTFGGSSNPILLVALDKSSGAVIFKHSLKISNVVERGYTLRADAQGNGYVGGISGTTPFLIRLTGLNTQAPAVDWIRTLGVGMSSVNSLELAENGDALLTLDVRGSFTSFVAARISTTGSEVWSKEWEATPGQRTNTHVIRLHDGVAYVGGRVAVQAADTIYGDGFLLALDAANGAYKSGALYYSGKTAATTMEHRIKGIVFSGTEAFTAVHGATANLNLGRYWGLWYQAPNDKLDLPAGDGSERLKNRGLTPQDPAGATGLGAFAGDAYAIDPSTAWKDMPTEAPTFYGEPRGHQDEQVQNHLLWQKLTLTP